ncbi:MAG TPA: ABC transporter permease [Bryobacteraceae bacterium]|jgi:predicted permease|nr:ABC transporter permease [Bryobacteraceae bacterium]
MADLQEALRQLKKVPGFTTTAVITLALGIGATTAIFTLVHQVMLKSLPVTKPDELWRIGDKIRCCNWGGYTQDSDGNFSLFSYEAYKNFRDHTPEFIDLAALQAGNAPLGVRRAGSQAPVGTQNGEFVSGNFFRTLSVRPWIGRFLMDGDDHESAAPVAVMSYHVWTDKYASDPSVVGANFQINGHPFTIIGVAPPGFYGAKLDGWGMPDLWLPLSTELLIDGEAQRLKRPNTNWLDIIGRVHAGVNPKSLEAKLRAEFHAWLASHVPDMEPGEKQTWQKQTLNLIPGGAGVAAMRDQYNQGLKLLLIAAACVLLVACGNLANLMLARGLKERFQTSLRVALGASRRRLIRKALVESVLLALVGGLLGIGVAYAGSKLILYLAFHNGGGPQNYVPVDASPSWPVLLFTLAVSVLTGILFGIAPAWMTSQVDPVEALRGSNRSVRGGSSLAQKSLVIGQAAMSLVLLSAAALLGRSLRNLEHQNFGFETKDRYLVSINPTLGNYKPEQMESLFRRIDERLLQIPGVRMVAPALYAPMSGDSWNEGIRIAGRPEPGPKEDTGAGWARVMPGFFETLGARMVQGRSFEDQDASTTRNVAVVNEAFVRRFFKKQNPIGQHFGMDRIQYAGKFEIVGVVRDMRYMTWDYKDPIGPMFWLPETQSTKYDDPQFNTFDLFSHFLGNIVVWAPGNPPGLETAVRKALTEVAPDLVVYSVDPYSKILSGDFQQENMIATLTMLFGVLGLILAAVGLYGVMAYTVEQRTSEIGIRMALGADRSRVVGMVLRGAFLQILIGLGLGIPLAILAGHLMTRQLFGVAPWDPLMLSIATVLLCGAALLASWLPAARAASVEPMVALRTE